MRTVKNDRRVKYTQTIIKETFLSLLEKKELSKITVMEICTLADINRATFYTHYLDTHHLYHSIEEAFYDEITKLLNALQNGPNDPNAISNVEKILNYLKDNKEMLYKNREMFKLFEDNDPRFISFEELVPFTYSKE